MNLVLDLSNITADQEYGTSVDSILKDEIRSAIRAAVRKELQEHKKALEQAIKSSIGKVLQPDTIRALAKQAIDGLVKEISKT